MTIVKFLFGLLILITSPIWLILLVLILLIYGIYKIGNNSI